MKTYQLIIVIALLSFLSCDRLADKTKEGINRGGEVVGESATEFFEGVSEGVDKTLECKIILSNDLQEKGLTAGVYDIDSQSSKNNNKLTLYIIFDSDFNKDVIAKAYNKSGLEIGRAKTVISGTKGDADYYDFLFDERTDIGFRNTITIE
ncbi:hypothetical protein [Winogradskyella psychrotolerans]|uniref:hypothetical protein n=1 Tax=Winogradskyella psychrotolerans TaxID=1344585 RepID=UPI001C06FC33|nr:hypothetical protein [Winogradskyella psychrotolerans]MBU2928445.1 hypothetical protein [Winogradskyella psychrotolerans]